jgi:hypothetical protein
MKTMFDNTPGASEYVPQTRSQKRVLSAVEDRRFSLFVISGFALFLAFAQNAALLPDSTGVKATLKMSMKIVQSVF